MFSVNVPSHALDSGRPAIGVQKLKPYCFCHYFPFLPFRLIKSGKDFKQIYLCGVD